MQTLIQFVLNLNHPPIPRQPLKVKRPKEYGVAAYGQFSFRVAFYEQVSKCFSCGVAVYQQLLFVWFLRVVADYSTASSLHDTWLFTSKFFVCGVAVYRNKTRVFLLHFNVF